MLATFGLGMMTPLITRIGEELVVLQNTIRRHLSAIKSDHECAGTADEDEARNSGGANPESKETGFATAERVLIPLANALGDGLMSVVSLVVIARITASGYMLG